MTSNSPFPRDTAAGTRTAKGREDSVMNFELANGLTEEVDVSVNSSVPLSTEDEHCGLKCTEMFC